jgi:hypothetical protein
VGRRRALHDVVRILDLGPLGELGAIRDALAAFQPRVAVAAGTIVRALRAALAAADGEPPSGQV